MKNDNSWLIQVPDMTTPYRTFIDHHFFCRCGQTDMVKVTLNELGRVENRCSNCGNDVYIDVAEFHREKRVFFWKTFNWRHECSMTDDAWVVTLFYESPVIDGASMQVVMKRTELFRYEVHHDGTTSNTMPPVHVREYHVKRDGIFRKVVDLLRHDAAGFMAEHIMANKVSSIDWLDVSAMDNVDQMHTILFFLRRPTLRELDFVYWDLTGMPKPDRRSSTCMEMLCFVRNGRTEKSIKRAQLRHYEIALKHGVYDPKFDYIVSRIFQDPNLLTKLVGLYHPKIKKTIFQTLPPKQCIGIFKFFRRHYSEKQLSDFFVRYMNDPKTFGASFALWRDTLQMLQIGENFTAFKRHFSKVPLNPKALHDEVVRISDLADIEKAGNLVFDYTPKALAARMKCGELSFELPADATQLHRWAKEMKNCMFSRAERIASGRSVIYGVFKAKKLTYAVEVADGKIVEAKGRANTPVPEEDLSVIYRWHRSNAIVQENAAPVTPPLAAFEKACFQCSDDNPALPIRSLYSYR